MEDSDQNRMNQIMRGNGKMEKNMEKEQLFTKIKQDMMEIS